MYSLDVNGVLLWNGRADANYDAKSQPLEYHTRGDDR